MNYRKGIILNLILIPLLLVLSLVVYLPERDKAVETVGQDVDLVNLNVSDIAAIAVINEESRFGLIHHDGQITLEPREEGASYSVEALQSFLFRISKLKAFSVIENVQKDSVYGLNSPRATITLILNSGDKQRLILGNANPLDGSSYLRREDPESSVNKVYLISASDADLFLSDPSYFSASFILPRVELGNLDSLDSVELEFYNGTFPSFSIENRGGFLFSLSDPFESTINYERTLKQLIFPVLSLSSVHAGGVHSSPLLSGEKVLTLNVSLKNDELYTLSLFNQDERILAGTETGEVLAELSKKDLPFLDLHYLDLLDGSAYHCNISEIESVVIEDSEKAEDYNISLSGESVTLEGQINGVRVEYPGMADFFDVLLKTGIARQLPDSTIIGPQERKSVFSIIVYKKNGGMDRLEFVPSDNGELNLFINGNAHFSTYYKTVLDIRKALSELILKEGA